MSQGSKRDSLSERSLRVVVGAPGRQALAQSRARVRQWFAREAPVIRWGDMQCPLGRLYAAVGSHGLCAVDFGRGESDFLRRFDPRARLEKDPRSVAEAMTQLGEYFAGQRRRFDLAVDLSALTPFQRSVLEVACRIAPGEVWTYHRVAEALRRPRSSRPVGQALARNPVPIVVPCHRVIASDGGLGGYSGGSGLKAKRWLLRLERAVW